MIKKVYNYPYREILTKDEGYYRPMKFKNFEFFKKNLIRLEYYNMKNKRIKIIRKKLITDSELKYFFDQIFIYSFSQEYNFPKSDVPTREFLTYKLKLPFLILFTEKDFYKLNFDKKLKNEDYKYITYKASYYNFKKSIMEQKNCYSINLIFIIEIRSAKDWINQMENAENYDSVKKENSIVI